MSIRFAHAERTTTNTTLLIPLVCLCIELISLLTYTRLSCLIEFLFWDVFFSFQSDLKGVNRTFSLLFLRYYNFINTTRKKKQSLVRPLNSGNEPKVRHHRTENIENILAIKIHTSCLINTVNIVIYTWYMLSRTNAKDFQTRQYINNRTCIGEGWVTIPSIYLSCYYM